MLKGKASNVIRYKKGLKFIPNTSVIDAIVVNWDSKHFVACLVVEKI